MTSSRLSQNHKRVIWKFQLGFIMNIAAIVAILPGYGYSHPIYKWRWFLKQMSRQTQSRGGREISSTSIFNKEKSMVSLTLPDVKLEGANISVHSLGLVAFIRPDFVGRDGVQGRLLPVLLLGRCRRWWSFGRCLGSHGCSRSFSFSDL